MDKATTKKKTPAPKRTLHSREAAAEAAGTNGARPGRKPTVRNRKKLILTQPVLPGVKYIKVRLNARTVVMLKSMKNFAYWKERYPTAEVID